MTDKEKKLVVDAIVKIADVTANHDAEYRIRDEKFVGVSKEVAAVTKKLSDDLDIADEVTSVLTNHLFRVSVKDLAKLLSSLLGDAEDDDDNDEEGEE